MPDLSVPDVKTLATDPIFAAFASRNRLAKRTVEISMYGQEIFEFEKPAGIKDVSSRNEEISEFAEAWRGRRVPPAVAPYCDGDHQMGIAIGALSLSHTRRWELVRTPIDEDLIEASIAEGLDVEQGDDGPVTVTRSEAPKFAAQHWCMLAEQDGPGFLALSRALTSILSANIDGGFVERYAEKKGSTTQASPSTD